MVALENSKLSQNMKLSNLNNNQQAAIQNAATYAAMDARNLGARVQSAQQNANTFLAMDMKNLSTFHIHIRIFQLQSLETMMQMYLGWALFMAKIIFLLSRQCRSLIINF